MKNTVITFVSSLIFVLFLFQGTSTAQCNKILANRSGSVYAAGPAKESFKATGNSVTVKVQKTGGRAQTIVNIYVNNQRKKYISFNNGNYTKTKSVVVPTSPNQNVRVEIVNQSVGNKFEYRLTCTGPAPSSLGSVSGNLVGQAKKTQTFDRVCASKNKINITISRTGGQARGTVIVKKNGRQIDSKVLNNQQTRMNLSYSNAGNARYTVELKNVSVGNTLGYRMSASQTN